MAEPIFAHPRWEYNSYGEYKRLIELSGFKSCYMDEMDLQSDNTYIFSTPDTWWHGGWPDAKCRIIYFCLEWYLDKIDVYSKIPCVETWATDKYWATRIGAKYVPMGSHPDLNPSPADMPEKVYDVATLWAGSYNRYHAEDLMKRVGAKQAPNGWGDERHAILSQSRMMVAVHQYPDAKTLAPQRWALAAAYKLPIISETLSDAGIFNDVTIQCDLENIGMVVGSWLEPANLGKLAAKGRELHQLLCYDLTFRKSVEGAL